MTGMFKHKDGGLKTTRVALVVFISLLVALGALYKAGQSKEKVLVQVAHLFEAPLEPEPQKPTPRKVEPQKPTPQEPEKVESPELPREASQAPKKEEEQQTSEPAKKALTKPVKKAEVEPLPQQHPPEKPAEKKAEATKPPMPIKKVAPPKLKFDPAPAESKPVPVQFPDLKSRLADKEERKVPSVKLPPEQYLDQYSQWRKSGQILDTKDTRISLRIVNLESVYNLFQMKVVAMRGDTPYLDLADQSRVAPASLESYSSTCFLVSRPWETWGEALAASGFARNDKVQVRYYTYAFVRNAIYARAVRAFEWSVAKQNLPKDTPQGDADVLGRAYALEKNGGGAFGVFVPERVDFKSGNSVTIDPLDCFGQAPDIMALKQAGLL